MPGDRLPSAFTFTPVVWNGYATQPTMPPAARGTILIHGPLSGFPYRRSKRPHPEIRMRQQRTGIQLLRSRSQADLRDFPLHASCVYPLASRNDIPGPACGMCCARPSIGMVFALVAAVGHDESVAGMAAVSDRGGLADGSFGSRIPRCARRPWLTYFTGLEREKRSTVVNDAADRGLGNPDQRRQLAQGQVRAPTGGDQQHTILQWQAPVPALAHWVHAFAPQRGDGPAELTRAQPGERDCPGRLRRRNHTSHSEMATRASQVPACGIHEGARCGSTALSRHSRSSALSSPSGRLSSSSNARSSEACAANAALHHPRSG